MRADVALETIRNHCQHCKETDEALATLRQLDGALDKIRAEIKSSIDAEDTDEYSDYRAGLWQAIKIIDKYKKEGVKE